jgi:hypothetical protein
MAILSIQDAYTKLSEQLTSKQPLFVSRIGGTDTDAVANYFTRDLSPSSMEQHYSKFIPICKSFNGFYSFRDEKSDYDRYIAELDFCYRRSRFLTVGGKKLQSVFFPGNLNANQLLQLQQRKHILSPSILELSQYMKSLLAFELIDCTSYVFVGKVIKGNYTLFRLLSQVLEGKRVLIVSPFERSIMANFANRTRFFKGDYKYPEFTPLFVNSPITYSGLPPELYPHQSWHETLDHLKHQVSGMDFDIALLACGSYALPIGTLIAEKLGRQALYIGGLLQLFFGIAGRRYQDDFFLSQINADVQIEPLEKNRHIEHISIEADAPTEAFGAYF